jgi:MFS transporter, OFA family, oxalate/formate antiporter
MEIDQANSSTAELAAGEIAPPAAVEAAGPSLYYGWIMLPLSMVALVASSPGQTFGVSIFNEPMRLSLQLSHGQLAAAYMLGTLLGAVPIVWVGSLMDRHGMRRSMLVAVTLFSLACVATSLVHGWLSLVFAFFLLRTLGPGALAFLSSNTLAYWFDRRLGTVEGLRQLGMAGAMAVIPALNLWLMTHFGWRSAYALLGAAIWLTLFPTFTWLFRNHPREVGQALDGQPEPQGDAAASRRSDWDASLTLPQALRSRAFWIVAGGTSAFSLIHTAVFFCLVPIFHDLGLSEEAAASMLMVFAASLAAMQLVGGTLADRMRPQWLMFGGLLGLAAAVGLLCFAESLATARAVGILLGISQGLFFGSTQPLLARYFGRAHLGKIRGVLMTLIVAASSLGPLIAGLTKDWTGGFSPALVAFALAPLPLAALSLFAASPRRSLPAAKASA